MARLELSPRHSLLSYLLNLVTRSVKDTLTIDVLLDDDTMAPFVFAVVPKKLRSSFQADRPDLRTYAKLVPLEMLPSSLALLTDCRDLIPVLLQEKVVKTLIKCEDLFVSMHVTDQNTVTPLGTSTVRSVVVISRGRGHLARVLWPRTTAYVAFDVCVCAGVRARGCASCPVMVYVERMNSLLRLTLLPPRPHLFALRLSKKSIQFTFRLPKASQMAQLNQLVRMCFWFIDTVALQGKLSSRAHANALEVRKAFQLKQSRQEHHRRTERAVQQRVEENARRKRDSFRGMTLEEKYQQDEKDEKEKLKKKKKIRARGQRP